MEAFAGFDWDDANRSKCQKHGVPIGEIEAVFQSRFRVAPDTKHSTTEDRFIAIGRTGTGRPLFVAFTIRVKGRQRLVRPISARYMHAKEIESYEAQNP
jgi:uncharacterized protein